jgi:hypothetical protein
LSLRTTTCARPPETQAAVGATGSSPRHRSVRANLVSGRQPRVADPTRGPPPRALISMPLAMPRPPDARTNTAAARLPATAVPVAKPPSFARLARGLRRSARYRIGLDARAPGPFPSGGSARTQRGREMLGSPGGARDGKPSARSHLEAHSACPKGRHLPGTAGLDRDSRLEFRRQPCESPRSRERPQPYAE